MSICTTDADLSDVLARLDRAERTVEVLLLVIAEMAMSADQNSGAKRRWAKVLLARLQDMGNCDIDRAARQEIERLAKR